MPSPLYVDAAICASCKQLSQIKKISVALFYAVIIN